MTFARWRWDAPAVCWQSLSWLGSCPHPRESMGGEISTPMARFTARLWPPCPLLLGRDSSACPEQSSRPRPLSFLSSGRGDTPRTQGEARRRRFLSGLTKLTPCHGAASPRRPRGWAASPRREGALRAEWSYSKPEATPQRCLLPLFPVEKV